MGTLMRTYPLSRGFLNTGRILVPVKCDVNAHRPENRSATGDQVGTRQP
jgi:hypothetical protein